MKNKIIYIIIASFILASCNDFLEPKSKSEFVPKDANSLNELLLGEAYPTPTTYMTRFLNLMDDDVMYTPKYQELNEEGKRTMWHTMYTWQSNMYDVLEELNYDVAYSNLYYSYYSLILGTNAVLDYIEDIDDDEELKNYVVAQALSLRGMFYLYLVNIYGQPYYYNKDADGVPLKLNSGVENAPIKRNSVAEVYEQIIKDLSEAEEIFKNLPKEYQWQADRKASLPMAQLLLSRTYLYMEEWQKAAEYAEKVIHDHSFSLLDLSTTTGFSVKENGYEDNSTYTNYHSYTSPEVIWVFGNKNDITEIVKETGDNNVTFFQASDSLMNCLQETPGDLRESRYVIRATSPMMVGGQFIFTPLAYGKIGMHSYNNSSFGRSLRVSEAYLNAAEAYAMLYKTKQDASARTNALNKINDLRKYRFTAEDYKAIDLADADKLITFIHNERRRELCFENHRWFDLRRWGMKELKHQWCLEDNTITTYVLEENDPGFTLPIPKVTLELNNNLVQNPLAPAPRQSTSN